MHPTDKELQAMFGEAPEGFSSAMDRTLQAALVPDEKEVRPMKKTFYRAPLLAALLLAAMLVAAYAVGTTPGVLDSLHQMGDWQRVPDAAVEMLPVTNGESVTLGPVTFTLTEALCDDHTMLATWNARLTDGSKALFVDETDYPNEAMPQAVLDFYGMLPGTTYSAAARTLGLPLYTVDAFLFCDHGTVCNDFRVSDGSISLINMADSSQAAKDGAREVTGQVQFSVKEFDPQTGKAIEGRSWLLKDETLTLPVQPAIETRRYVPQGNADVGEWFTVDEVIAEQTCMGVYLSARMTLKPGASFAVFDAPSTPRWLEWYSGTGEKFPSGMNHRWDDWPEQEDGVCIKQNMLGLNELPETLTLCLVEHVPAEGALPDQRKITQRVFLK